MKTIIRHTFLLFGLLSLTFTACKKDEDPGPVYQSDPQFQLNKKSSPLNYAYFFEMDNQEFWGILRDEANDSFYLAELNDAGVPMQRFIHFGRKGDIRLVDAESDGVQVALLIQEDLTADHYLLILDEKGIVAQQAVTGLAKHVELVGGRAFLNAGAYLYRYDIGLINKDSVQVPKILSVQRSEMWESDDKLYLMNYSPSGEDTRIDLISVSTDLQILNNINHIEKGFFAIRSLGLGTAHNQENYLTFAGSMQPTSGSKGFGTVIFDDQLQRQAIIDHRQEVVLATVLNYGANFYGDVCYLSGGRSMASDDYYPGVMTRYDLSADDLKTHQMDTTEYAYYYFAREQGSGINAFGSTQDVEFHAHIPLSLFK